MTVNDTVAPPGGVGISISDDDRDAVVARLREAVGAGRLDLDEFDKRAARAYAARTLIELGAVTADLPGPPPRFTVGEPVVARFGRITVTDTMVRTSTRSFPLRGSVWRTFDYWQTRRVTPEWAIVLAIVGFFFMPFVSLLFLLVKEQRMSGVLQVAVWDGIRQHAVDLPVRSSLDLQNWRRQVDYVRSLARD
jgi:hypothetical protein